MPDEAPHDTTSTREERKKLLSRAKDAQEVIEHITEGGDLSMYHLGYMGGIILGLLQELDTREQEHQEELRLARLPRDGDTWDGVSSTWKDAHAFQRNLCDTHYENHEYNEPKEGVACFVCAEDRHVEEIRKAGENAWDACDSLMAKTFPGWPEAATKVRNENPHRAPSTPLGKPEDTFSWQWHVKRKGNCPTGCPHCPSTPPDPAA